MNKCDNVIEGAAKYFNIFDPVRKIKFPGKSKYLCWLLAHLPVIAIGTRERLLRLLNFQRTIWFCVCIVQRSKRQNGKKIDAASLILLL